ncbi:MAG: aldehyde dehydrogenase family protein [Mesorhizobium sp.]|nr:MAG: aldehyde dehydrogenase family protein [Mesorhizobium sp.]
MHEPLTAAEYKAIAADIQFPTNAFIDGAFRPANSGKTSKTTNPATSETLAEIAACDATDVDFAVAKARQAFDDGRWHLRSPGERKAVLLEFAKLLERNRHELAVMESLDSGKPVRECQTVDVPDTIHTIRWHAELIDKLYDNVAPVGSNALTMVVREPVGVVGCVLPWNFPLLMLAWKIGPALAAGCTVVLKASEDGPAPLLAFAELVHEAGFPAGSVNILTGFGHDCGQRLTSHPLVSRVAFTGGPSTARAIVRNTAENLAYTTLELGGKSPVVVFADADLDSAANAVVAGIFAASGQSCVAGSRLLVERSIKAEFLDRLKHKAEAIRIGDPQDPATEMGPLATPRQREWIETIVAESLANGGTLVTGGKKPDNHPHGFYYAPTIIDAEDSALPCVREELFGPVLSVLTFDTEAEALALANDTPFGLASGVFTTNLAKAHRMVRHAMRQSRNS